MLKRNGVLKSECKGNTKNKQHQIFLKKSLKKNEILYKATAETNNIHKLHLNIYTPIQDKIKQGSIHMALQFVLNHLVI